MMVVTVAVKGLQEGDGSYDLAFLRQYSMYLVHGNKGILNVLQDRYAQDKFEAVAREGYCVCIADSGH